MSSPVASSLDSIGKTRLVRKFDLHLKSIFFIIDWSLRSALIVSPSEFISMTNKIDVSVSIILFPNSSKRRGVTTITPFCVINSIETYDVENRAHIL